VLVSRSRKLEAFGRCTIEMVTFEAAKGVLPIVARAARSGRHVEELPFRPRALVLWWSRQKELGLASGNRGGIGIAVDGSEQACSAWAADAAVPTTLTRLAGDTALVGMGDPTEPRAALRGVVSYSGAGFALDWSALADGVWHVHYLALGGSELHGATVGKLPLNRPAVTPVTRLGFSPEFLLFLAGAGEASAEPIVGLSHGIGLATGETRQAAVGIVAQVGDRSSTVRSSQRTDAVVALPELKPSNEFDLLARLVSLDSDGFTLDVLHAAPKPLPLAYLALAGGRYATGADTAPQTSRRSKTASVGFEPAALLTFSWGMARSANAKEVPRLCLGGADGRGNAGCLSWTIRSRGVWPLEPRVRSVLGSVVEVMDTKSGNLHARAVFDRADSHGFTLDWDTDGLRREFAYAAFASATARRPLRRRIAGTFQAVARFA
jgi:hypothetical protein